MKPFKPPTIVNRSQVRPSQSRPEHEPPTKKRRISQEPENKDFSILKSVTLKEEQEPVKRFQLPKRAPLSLVENVKGSTHDEAEADNVSRTYYNVLWRKFTTKKNKTWDGDGVLCVNGTYATLQDVSGKELGRGPCKGPLESGSQVSLAGREIEVDSPISREDFLASRTSLGKTKNQSTTVSKGSTQTKVAPKRSLPTEASSSRPMANKPMPVPTTKQLISNAFKAPLLNNTVLESKKNSMTPVPRHDPNVEGALVMKRPKHIPKGKQVVDVVIDPLLTKHLREHQRTGVAFMYECVMGMKGFTGEGAILADEMGLGKTLQTIALIWTLLKQNPIHDEGPVIRKALIVCPVTLINNWRKEFVKWLGRERVGVFVAGNKNTRLTDFTLGRAYNVMIIGYERLRNVQADLQKGPGIDLVIIDEGHRLKTSQNKAAQAIKSLNTERRIVLSGTPLQNDLSEFYTMVDFVNPGLLKKYSAFKREFETPILKSRQPGASAEDIENGEARSEELAQITGMFILRRTAEILSRYLPSKTEYVVFCKPTAAQATVYRSIISSPIFSAALGSPSLSLELINILKKVCNSPSLLVRKGSDRSEEPPIKPDLLSHLPSHLLRSPGASGKLQVLDSLLHHIRLTAPSEKLVLVSNYTSTLDLLSNLLTSMSYPFLRLDGSTPPSKRQDLVDRFNRSPSSSIFAFLLSARAGGTGLNLVGASRCVLFDADWNPATDLQAMARVHRDGQRKEVRIYRLITAGALDEKIFQRQVSKTGLAERIVDGKGGGGGGAQNFTREELRDLFSFEEEGEEEGCQTHRLLGCGCGGLGQPLGVPVEGSGDGQDGDGPEDSSGERDEEEEKLEDLDSLLLPASSKRGFSSARDFDANEASRIASRNLTTKDKMLGLMQYTHFDPVHVPKGGNVVEEEEHGDDNESGEEGIGELGTLESAIEDPVLRAVLREDGGRIRYVFGKMSS